MSLFWPLLGYLLGSVPTGYVVVKAIKGIDIRTYGSGNIGATNAGRLLGKQFAIGIAIFDMLKGGIAVLAASLFTSSDTVLAITGVMAVLGHNYPVWLRFKGGKGVATTFGVFAFYDFFNPYPALLGAAVWYLTLKTTRYVSVASMVGLFASALIMPVFDMPRPYYIAAVLLAALAVWRHQSNIRLLLDNLEEKTH